MLPPRALDSMPSPARRRVQDVFDAMKVAHRVENKKVLVDLEGEMFKDGYYKAFIFLSGPCLLCPECAKLKGEPCNFGLQARPCMESCGIDVYETARNNGFPIEPLREMTETQNLYCLMLVD